MTDAEADKAFRETLQGAGLLICKGCGRELDRGDVSWNEGDTGEGTPYTWSQIVCQACGTEAAHWSSWACTEGGWDEWVERILPDIAFRARDR